MKIGVLTSSRADFGIYIPLLKLLEEDSFFDLEIIAFGTHLSEKFGYTVNEIINSGFKVKHRIDTVPNEDTPEAISAAIGKTILRFSEFWNNQKFDLVFVLGDRFEMFAAVSAGSPFNVKFAHIHAGETTLGAIDNSYRHSISLMSEFIFTVAEDYKKRAIEIVGRSQNIHNVGSLSIDNLIGIEYFSIEQIKSLYNVDLTCPTILFTFHPETISYQNNENYINQIIESFAEIVVNYQMLITLPNADTFGQLIRNILIDLAKSSPRIIVRESLGMKGYLSCMKHCSFMLGNTSSGFVEASFFPKYVINLGDRQKGRIITPNILSIPITKDNILNAIKKIERAPQLSNLNTYGKGNSAENIVKILKEIN